MGGPLLQGSGAGRMTSVTVQLDWPTEFLPKTEMEGNERGDKKMGRKEKLLLRVG